MTHKDILPIMEKLDQVLDKLENRSDNKYLSLNQVSELTTLSTSTIRRYINKGELKCSKKLGKLLFKESEILKWLKS